MEDMLLDEVFNIRDKKSFKCVPDDTSKEGTFALMRTIINALTLKGLSVMKSTEVLEYGMKRAFERATCFDLAFLLQVNVWEDGEE